MKKRAIQNIFIAVLLSALILLGGQCGPSKQQVAGPYAGGTKGISLSFVSGAPATEFSQADPQPVKVELANNGEYDVDSGQAQVQLYGLYLPDYSLSDAYTSTSGKIFGITKENNVPGMQQVDMGTLQYKEKLTPEGITPILWARVCYPYQSNSQISACIGSVGSQASTQQVCSLTEEKLKQGFTSGSPVQVTSVQEKPYGSQVSFAITIENKGTGDVYDPSAQCNSLQSINKDTVGVQITPSDVQCRFINGQSGNSGSVQLSGGKTVLFCTKLVTGASSGNYEQDMNIQLNYKYVDRTSISMTIRGS